MAGQKGNTNKPIDKEVRNNNITIRFSDEELKEFEKIANDLDIPKTRFIRNLALSSLEDAKIFHKLGALKGAKRLIDFKERFKNYKNYQTLSIS